MPMRRVAAPVWDELKVNLIVVGLLTSLNCAIGKEATREGKVNEKY